MNITTKERENRRFEKLRSSVAHKAKMAAKLAQRGTRPLRLDRAKRALERAAALFA